MTLPEALAVLQDLQALHAGRGRYEWGQDGAPAPLYPSTAYAKALDTVLALVTPFAPQPAAPSQPIPAA